MDEIAVSTVVYLPPEEIYEFLVDFPRYADYSKHLRDVRQSGDGSPGTRYGLSFSWWKLSYTAESKVTDVTPPTRIDWTITKDVHAVGRWRVEELDDLPAEAPSDADAACRVFFEVEYDPDSVSAGDIDLPRFVSLGWVIDKLRPVLQKEAERIVERIVADIEGRPRRVELTVHSKPGP
ncbi:MULTISPECIES: type II toxin-antitoxin system RatA family toxin [Haloferax]|uniref:Polyketide cyclase / dehydrase and lipid transport n=1 Tax=Haloferax massiliensis TaxID=1476858 RepID=A0A0D6JRC5_9EURY|nr:MULTISPECIES: SRPBCC family protein [Haloferax]MDS0240338.1 SRPBCC family protein [Haloferax sp. S2CR25]MDS0443459.1 SRPBCC family protein [Haloferax sp. S2CR25-2]CQR50456.1 Polyketide cyclase / dehydrase and lipid transport [Haloferax massiliensis]